MYIALYKSTCTYLLTLL